MVRRVGRARQTRRKILRSATRAPDFLLLATQCGPRNFRDRGPLAATHPDTGDFAGGAPASASLAVGKKMHKVSYAFVALSLLLSGSLAQAQTAGTITFTANRTSSSTAFAPVLTWSTSPVASSCAASGAWSGTKFASGSETLATISSSKSYTLTCAWGNGTATIRWTRPTTNTDGSSLGNLAGFKILYGTSASALNRTQQVNSATATSATIGALGAGTWYFAVRAVNSNGTESVNSAVVQKTITAVTAAKTVNITISGSPTPTPTYRTISTRVYDVIFRDGARVRGREVGSIAKGKACDGSYFVSPAFYGVNRADVRLTVTPRSTRVIVRCEPR